MFNTEGGRSLKEKLSGHIRYKKKIMERVQLIAWMATGNNFKRSY